MRRRRRGSATGRRSFVTLRPAQRRESDGRHPRVGALNQCVGAAFALGRAVVAGVVDGELDAVAEYVDGEPHDANLAPHPHPMPLAHL